LFENVYIYDLETYAD